MNQQELLTGALVGLEDTGHASGTATAPSTATDILTSPVSLKAGRYEIDVTVSMSGTAETLVRNLLLRLGTAALASPTAILSVPGTNTYRFRVTITNAMIIAGGGVQGGSAALQVRTVAAPTGGAIYTVSVRSTLIGG